MSDLPPDVFQKWGHSREEDAGDVTVFRPVDFDFPPARGRRGLELGGNGELIQWDIGRGDAEVPVRGRWEAAGPKQIRVTFEGDVHPPEVLEVVDADAQVLKVRRRGA